MSDLTEDTPPQKSIGKSKDKSKDKTIGQMQTNPSPDKDLAAFRDHLRKVTLKRCFEVETVGHPPSTPGTNAATGAKEPIELCASYHVRGSCYE
jgi:hypothetical protein